MTEQAASKVLNATDIAKPIQDRVQANAEILRSQGPAGWSKDLLKSIAGRIYSPVEEPGGLYRVERYSYTSRYMDVTGTRLRQHSPNARIEFVDLTPDQPTGAH